jgi:hypothetical protein
MYEARITTITALDPKTGRRLSLWEAINQFSHQARQRVLARLKQQHPDLADYQVEHRSEEREAR